MASEVFIKDIRLVQPDSNLPSDKAHYLLYLPWEDHYLSFIPDEYQSFFLVAKPYLGVRSTDVHVAHCFRHLPELIATYEQYSARNLDDKIVALALILHDIGWSILSQDEIVASLGVEGLKVVGNSVGPKEKHAIEGEKLAHKLLMEYQNELQITEEQISMICQCVRWHDQPEQVAQNSQLADEIQVIVDADHLWSFVYEGFWMDVMRKGVEPNRYVQNLNTDLDNYFVTSAGKKLARKLLSERMSEIE